MNQTVEGWGMGWLPDYPDFRDHTSERGEPPPGQEEAVPGLLEKLGVKERKEAASVPSSVDLTEGFPDIEDQGSLGSCTANAAAGVIEYFERQAFGKHIDASRLFLYKATRNLMGVSGDTGAFLRTTMQAMVHFGVPPEEFWPYDVATFDTEPSAFCYSFAQTYQALEYYRLEPPGTEPEALLARIKTNLAAGLPSMFGFTVYSSYQQARESGELPYPISGEKKEGGHAVVAAGYDDKKKIRNQSRGGTETTGAILIRNSWGTGWGADGNGWLPYDYVLNRLTRDWWSLLKSEWIDTGVFGIE
jgi:C1A family cysteine protease